MEKFKVDIYLSEHDGNAVFKYETLSGFQSGKVIGMLLSLLGITDCDTSSQAFYPFLDKEIDEKIIYNDSVDSGVLSTVFSQIATDDNDDVYIIWDIDCSVDRMRLSDLIDNWEYIWYDTSDEAVILYLPHSKNIVFVTDRGYLSYRRM